MSAACASSSARVTAAPRAKNVSSKRTRSSARKVICRANPTIVNAPTVLPVGSPLAEPASLLYFDARGAAEVIRTLFAVAEVEYKDVRYKFEFESGKPKVEEQHGIDQEAGKFSANLNRLPVLKLEDGRAIGQSKAIERFVSRELGLMGEDEVEAAQIDAYAEHIRDLRDQWSKARGNPFGPPDDETKAKIEKFYDEGMPSFMKKLEGVTGAYGCAVGNKTSYADVALYVALTQTFSDEARAAASYADCPNVTAAIEAVGAKPGVKKWLEGRPENMF